MEKIIKYNLIKPITTLLLLIELFCVDSGRFDTLQGFFRHFEPLRGIYTLFILKAVLEPYRHPKTHFTTHSYPMPKQKQGVYTLLIHWSSVQDSLCNLSYHLIPSQTYFVYPMPQIENQSQPLPS